MATPKSPFLIFRELISPKQCEAIVSRLGFFQPDLNTDGDPIKMMRHHEGCEEELFRETIQPITPTIFKHYGAEYRGTEQMAFEFKAGGVVGEPECSNSQYLRQKWVQTKARDFTAVLFLSDYSSQANFDTDYEVYGGKLEFPQHGFGFNPERGTMVVFPSGPHFIHANADIIAGDLFQVKIHFAAKEPFLYQPTDFPGDYKSWFTGL